MAEVLLGFYEPKKYTANEALVAGNVVEIKGNDLVGKTNNTADVVAGFVLVDAASGAPVTVVHGAWVHDAAAPFTAGPLQPSTSGTLEAYTTGRVCGFARNTTDAFIF